MCQLMEVDHPMVLDVMMDSDQVGLVGPLGLVLPRELEGDSM